MTRSIMTPGDPGDGERGEEGEEEILLPPCEKIQNSERFLMKVFFFTKFTSFIVRFLLLLPLVVVDKTPAQGLFFRPISPEKDLWSSRFQADTTQSTKKSISQKKFCAFPTSTQLQSTVLTISTTCRSMKWSEHLL